MLTIKPVPAFDDNYIWLITCPESRDAFVVDPGDGNAVLTVLEREDLNLTGILITHHHYDHVGGLEQLRAAFSPVVYGPDNPSIEGLDKIVVDGDKVEVLGHSFSVMSVPGHTLDHIAYYHQGELPLLFCGDTLFAGGCGRVFEGTPEMMHNSLQTLAVLPGNTQIFCAHEYTLANLVFAQAVEPDNQALTERVAAAQASRARSEPTVPSTLDLELATNPFLRCSNESLVQSMRTQGRLKGENSTAVFTAVRGWKDSF